MGTVIRLEFAIALALFALINFIQLETTEDYSVEFAKEDKEISDYYEERELDGLDGSGENGLVEQRERPFRRRRRQRKECIRHCNDMRNLDFCWKVHDECQHILAYQSRYGLNNELPYSVYHCNCEVEFYDCLHRINSTVSNKLGKLYFRTQDRCFRDDYPILFCEEYDTELENRDQHRCIRYLQVSGSPTKVQWFDLPYYHGKTPKDALFANKGRW